MHALITFILSAYHVVKQHTELVFWLCHVFLTVVPLFISLLLIRKPIFSCRRTFHLSKAEKCIFYFFLKVEREITENVLALIRTTGDFIHQGREVQVMMPFQFRFRSKPEGLPIVIVQSDCRQGEHLRALRPLSHQFCVTRTSLVTELAGRLLEEQSSFLYTKASYQKDYRLLLPSIRYKTRRPKIMRI